MLDAITPVLLTHDEAPNIGRSLEPLRWARDIVVVDSFSTDETLAIVSSFPQARVFQRAFDGHAPQWKFAVHETGIKTEWVLALDADYFAEAAFVEELRSLSPPADVRGYEATFTYWVLGRALRGSLYPPVTVLFRREGSDYLQDGHTQRVLVPGRVQRLRERLRHDDRKSLSRWLRTQDHYMREEVRKIETTPWRRLGWVDRLRSLAFPAPFVALAWALLARGCLLDGRAGLYYAWQRAVAEALLALRLIEHRLGDPGSR